MVCDYLETTAGLVNSWYHAGNPSRNPELAVLVADDALRGARLAWRAPYRSSFATACTCWGCMRPSECSGRNGMSLLVVGSVALDSVETPFGR
jgi:hypothetical protein